MLLPFSGLNLTLAVRLIQLVDHIIGELHEFFNADVQLFGSVSEFPPYPVAIEVEAIALYLPLQQSKRNFAFPPLVHLFTSLCVFFEVLPYYLSYKYTSVF